MIGAFYEKTADDLSIGHRLVWAKLKVSATTGRHHDRLATDRLAAAQASSVHAERILTRALRWQRRELHNGPDSIGTADDSSARLSELALRARRFRAEPIQCVCTLGEAHHRDRHPDRRERSDPEENARDRQTAQAFGLRWRKPCGIGTQTGKDLR